MSTKMLVTMKMDQRLMMSQQLRQAITLLQYNTIELKQVVQQCLEANPLLEVEETDETTYSELDQTQLPTKYTAVVSKNHHYFEDEENPLENYSIPESLRMHLLEQTLLCKFDPIKQAIAEAIIDAIDEDGYLTMSLEDIQKSLGPQESLNPELLLQVLKIIQTFDPLGVGYRDLQECLLIQLDNTTDKNSTTEITRKIISDHFELIAQNNSTKVMKRLKISEEECSAAFALLRSLNPHPGVQYSSEINFNIEPELYVKKIKNTWRVCLSESILTNIKINNYYKDLISKNKKDVSYKSMKQELNDAKGLLNGLKRRNQTLLTVAKHIVELQNDFLEKGQAFMKPMSIVDISSVSGLHESTISRITTGKYIATPKGVFELKYFFNNQVSTRSGEGCSAMAVKELIKEIILHEKEDHIVSDDEIATILQNRGIHIARRTVAKYRIALKILPSYQRLRAQGVPFLKQIEGSAAVSEVQNDREEQVV